MLLDDLLRQRQAKAGAAALGRKERFEDSLADLGSDPGTAVGDGYPRPVSRARRRHAQGASLFAFAHGVASVAYEVEKRLAQLILVRRDQHGVFGEGCLDHDPSPLELVSEEVE